MFACSKCGVCCKLIYRSHIIEKSMLKPDGSCKFLIDNLCSIYENRPDYCNIELSYSKYFSHLSLDEYYNANLKICNNIQEELNIPKIFRLKTISN